MSGKKRGKILGETLGAIHGKIYYNFYFWKISEKIIKYLKNVPKEFSEESVGVFLKESLLDYLEKHLGKLPGRFESKMSCEIWKRIPVEIPWKYFWRNSESM